MTPMPVSSVVERAEAYLAKQPVKSLDADHPDVMLREVVAALKQAHEALKPFAEYAPYVEMFVEGRAKFGGSPTLPTKHFRLADFRRAKSALEDAK